MVLNKPLAPTPIAATLTLSLVWTSSKHPFVKRRSPLQAERACACVVCPNHGPSPGCTAVVGQAESVQNPAVPCRKTGAEMNTFQMLYATHHCSVTTTLLLIYRRIATLAPPDLIAMLVNMVSLATNELISKACPSTISSGPKATTVEVHDAVIKTCLITDTGVTDVNDH